MKDSIHTNILLDRMLAHADPSQVAGLSRFFKTGPGQYGEGDKFLGIKVPVTRAVVKECWKQLCGFPELEECIRSEYHEVRLAALLALVEIFRHAGKHASTRAPASPQSQPGATGASCQVNAAPDGRVRAGQNSDADGTKAEHAADTKAVIPDLIGDRREQCIQFYLSHTAFINNWDLVDLSCYPLLGEWLLDRDRTLLYDLARNGQTIWEQRIGIVSTMTFIRHGQLDDTFAIADILLHHPHDLIHKAVGWLLREAGKRNKAALEDYLLGPDPAAGTPHPDPAETTDGDRQRGRAPRYQTMPRTALRYAIERFPEAERQQYLKKTH